MQRLFLSMESGSAPVGFEQWVFRARGPAGPGGAARGVGGFRRAARDAAHRFRDGGVAEPLQVVLRHVDLPWAEQDWARRHAAEHERRSAFLRSEHERGFDVGVAPLSA